MNGVEIDISEKMKLLSASTTKEQYLSQLNNYDGNLDSHSNSGISSRITHVNSNVEHNADLLIDALSAPAMSCRVCTLDLRKGQKYFVSGLMGLDKSVTTFIVDSGADISILTPSMVCDLPGRVEVEAMEVRGFNGDVGASITEKVEVEIDFCPGKLRAPFYICEAPFAIIGTDLLQAGLLSLSLSTGDELFMVRGVGLKTCCSAKLSVMELEKRRRMGERSYRKEGERKGIGNRWMRLAQSRTLAPHSTVFVKAGTLNNARIPHDHSVLSFFDENELDIYIPSLTFGPCKYPWSIPVHNTTASEIHLPRGFVVGEIVAHDSPMVESRDADVNVAEIFEMSALLKSVGMWGEEGKDVNMPEKRHNDENGSSFMHESIRDSASCLTLTNVNKSETTVERDLNHDPVDFSSLVGIGKVDSSTLEKCRKDGINFDMTIDVAKPEVVVKKDKKVDIEMEKKKSLNCGFWPDKTTFLSQFELSNVNELYIEPLCDLLWQFCHIFFNEEVPEQFRKGITNIEPVRVARLPNVVPKKEKVRECPDSKLSHLKMHIKNLLDTGVIVEATDISDIHASPVHIVIEQRYVASKDAVEEKSRLTVDARQINKTLVKSAYPLPLCDHFRRKIAQKDYRVFSNLDMASYYHQIPVDKETSKCFGMHALNRIFVFRRLLQGCSLSPSIGQSIVDQAFDDLENTHPFEDDVTIASVSEEKHLNEDLPQALATASYYNMLMKAKKCIFFKSEARILGHLVGEEKITLSSEKIKKIREIGFPDTKKKLISALAFFQYFSRLCPRYSELSAPLRRLAKDGVRYQPTDVHRQAFEDVKEHLLDPRLNVLRMPSADLADTVVVFTDASASSTSCVVTQMMRPLKDGGDGGDNDGRKELHIVGVWSSVVPEGWANHPIWLLELCALWETTRKFAFLLTGRPFYAVTDSETVRRWASLDHVPKDLARKILSIQSFDVRILFLESRLNPADTFSRGDEEEEAVATYARFLEDRIYNGKGEKVDWKLLFSKRRAQEAHEFFVKSRRQKLSRAVSASCVKTPVIEDNVVVDKVDSEVTTLKVSDNRGVNVGERVGEVVKEFTKESVPELVSIAAMALDDEDLLRGRSEVIDDDEDGSFRDVVLPIFDDQRLEEVKKLQEGDLVLDECVKYVKGELELPDKREALLMHEDIQKFLMNKSCFRLTDQGILVRIWLHPNGQVTPLIVVGGDKLHGLIEGVHRLASGNGMQCAHVGMRKTMERLCERFFAFGMRRKVNNYVSACAECRLNNHARTRPEKDGEQIITENGQLFIVDFAGPFSSFGRSSATGRPRYIFVGIDANSRYCYAVVTKSCGDDDVMEGMQEVRRQMCGFPARVACDNAIMRQNSNAKRFLEENGVSILHGMATVSRCQAKVEKCIGTLSRLITKYHTENPSLPFEKLVSEAVLTHNSTPSDALPRGMTPRQVHFVRPPISFLQYANEREITGTRSVVDAIKAARVSGYETLRHNVRDFLKRKARWSPMDHSRKLRVGDLCLKKKTSFPISAPRKLAFRLNIDAFIIVSKVASNAYRCRSIMDGGERILPGDVLMLVHGYTEDNLRRLVLKMEETAVRNSAVASGMETRARTAL